MARTVLLVLLILILLAVLPVYPWSTGWGPYPASGAGLLLAILIVLIVLDRV
jgi:hypothetical protein